MKYKSFFPGLMVYLHNSSDVPKPIRGDYAVIRQRIPADHDIYKMLGYHHLHWIAETAGGVMVYLNEQICTPVPPDGAVPAKITLEALLRTCHADPRAILGDSGSP